MYLLNKYIPKVYENWKVINPKDWVSVLDGHFVKLVVIYAHPHCTVLILYEKYQYSPRGHTGSYISLLNQLLQLQFEFHQLSCAHAVRGF